MGRKRSYATLYRTRRRQDIAALTYDCCIRTVLGSLCNALGQCRRTKTAGEQRKSALVKKEGKRERRRASTSSFFPRLLPFFFSPLSSLSWTSLLFTCYVLHWTWLKRRRWTRIRQVHLINQPGNWRRIIHFHVIYWVINSLVFSVLCIGSWKCCTIWSRFDCLKWSVQSLAWQQHHNARVCPGCQRWSSSV